MASARLRQTQRASRLLGPWSAEPLLCLRSFSAISGPGGPGGDPYGKHRGRTIDFGFKDVPREEKQDLVGQVFRSVAPSYDIMNDLMSGGLHRLWKDRLVEKLRPVPTSRHLDVAGGTGDVAFRVFDAMRAAAQQPGRLPAAAAAVAGAAEAGAGGHITVCDINPAMLAEGQKKAAQRGISHASIDWVEGNAERLPFPDASFDSYTIAFGIRNVTNRQAALGDAYRVLKVGGRFMCLEFSKVVVPGLQQLYDAYSFNVIPQVGRIVAGDADSYQYLVESIRMFPDQETFARMIEEAGFRGVEYENLTAGVVAIHSGFKV